MAAFILHFIIAHSSVFWIIAERANEWINEHGAAECSIPTFLLLSLFVLQKLQKRRFRWEEDATYFAFIGEKVLMLLLLLLPFCCCHQLSVDWRAVFHFYSPARLQSVHCSVSVNCLLLLWWWWWWYFPKVLFYFAHFLSPLSQCIAIGGNWKFALCTRKRER